MLGFAAAKHAAEQQSPAAERVAQAVALLVDVAGGGGRGGGGFKVTLGGGGLGGDGEGGLGLQYENEEARGMGVGSPPRSTCNGACKALLVTRSRECVNRRAQLGFPILTLGAWGRGLEQPLSRKRRTWRQPGCTAGKRKRGTRGGAAPGLRLLGGTCGSRWCPHNPSHR